VRYVAVTGPGGAPIVSAGTPAVASSWSPADAGPGPRLELGPGARARATGPFIGPGRGAGWRARTGAPPDEPLPWQALADARIVIEFEPLALQQLSAHALATMVIGGCAALVLLAVHLGPSFFVDQQSLKLANGDRVEVKGSRILLDGTPTLIAQEITRGDESMVLRDANGFPLWAG
jgi:hypothetical protein